MKKLLSKKNIIILAGISLITLVVSLIYRPGTPLPQLLSSTPTENALNVSVTNALLLKFDSAIDTERIKVISNPPEEWVIQNGINPKIVSLKSKQFLYADSQYTLTITYGDELLTTLNFKTIPQQGDPRYTQSVLLEMENDYPLAVKLPHIESNYRLIYSAPLTIEITSKNPNLTSQELIDEVKTWVTQNGVDASTHKYVIAP